MLERLKRRIKDMGTIKALCEGAERYANQDGEASPAAEHLVLAALDLPDESVDRLFDRLGVSTDDFRCALARQHADALKSIGVHVPDHLLESDPVGPTRIYSAQSSARTLMEKLASKRREQPGTPLCGAHVIIAAASMQYDIVRRALTSIGVDEEALRGLANEERAGEVG